MDQNSTGNIPKNSKSEVSKQVKKQQVIKASIRDDGAIDPDNLGGKKNSLDSMVSSIAAKSTKSQIRPENSSISYDSSTSDSAAANVNIATHLTNMAEQNPYMHAVVFPEGRDSKGRVSYTHFTYRQLERETTLLSKGFLRAGIHKGCRTVLMAKPSLDFFASAFALFRIGAVPIMIDPGMGIKNIKKCLEEAEPDAFVGITKAHIARVVLGWQRGKIKILIGVDRKTPFVKMDLQDIRTLGKQPGQIDFPIVKVMDQAAILFTSGSTGSPKGAIYTHRNFNAQIQLLKDVYKITPGEIDLCTFPLFALFSPALGITAIIPDMDFTKPAKVDPNKIFEAVANFGVTNMFGSPALLKRIAKAGVANKLCLSTLNRVISAGAPVPYQTLKQLTRILGKNAEIHTPYGATEALPICSISSTEILSETAEKTARGRGVCVGKPVAAVEVKIIKITDEPIEHWSLNLMIPDGEIGEIVVRGPQVTASYHNRPEANLIGKISDNEKCEIIHRMGDLGYLDEKGRVWFCGRKAHRVKTESETMYTVPCESIFNTHKKVYRTALVGVNSGSVEIPVLCVETEDKLPKQEREKLKIELLTLASKRPLTKSIETVIFHDSFPVDVRHNSKIFREKLKVWAKKELS